VKHPQGNILLLIIGVFSIFLFSSCLTTTVDEAVEVEKSYTVGQLGPAGGLVFYDKGSYSDGWRYLELAPSESELSLQWGPFGTLVEETSSEIGEGKNNTERIASAIRDLAMRPQAATYCDELVIGGYDDWFLPSLDELDLVFWELSQKDLGELQKEGFGYWSSSEYDENFAWGQGFSKGVTGKIEKSELFLVRAIRSF